MADTINSIKNRIIRRIKSLSQDKLKTLDDYLNQLEDDKNTKEEILSFAGSFQGMDEDFFNDLTVNLSVNRKRGSDRIL